MIIDHIGQTRQSGSWIVWLDVSPSLQTLKSNWLIFRRNLMTKKISSEYFPNLQDFVVHQGQSPANSMTLTMGYL